jgi:hypothetical protein
MLKYQMAALSKKSILILAVTLAFVVSITNFPAYAAMDITNKLETINDHLTNAENKLVQVTANPEPTQKLTRQLDTIADYLLHSGIYYFFTHGSHGHKLITGPLSTGEIEQLNNIVSVTNEIINTAHSFENSPGGFGNNPAVQAQLNNIINEATAINARALTFVSGTIIIEKDTVGGDGTFNFYTNSTAYPTFSITTVGGVGTMTLHNMPILAGIALGETGGPSNFAFTSVSCSNVQGSNIFFLFPASKAATLQLTSGSNVVKCTFVNTASSPTSIG